MTWLHVNVDITELMKINNQQEEHIPLNRKVLKQVDKFTHLGSISTTSGETEDIKVQLRKARHIGPFNTLKPVWRSTISPPETSWGSSTTAMWYCYTGLRLGACQVHAIQQASDQVYINSCLRRILKIWCPQKIKNLRRPVGTSQIRYHHTGNCQKKEEMDWHTP